MDSRQMKHVDEMHGNGIWDMTSVNFERNQCWLGSSNDTVVLSALWPSTAIVIVVG